MRTTFVLCLLFGCLVAGLMANDAKMGEMIAACMSENGVTKQDLEDLAAGKTKPEDIKDNMKCATQCWFVKNGMMDAQGAFQPDAMKKHFADMPMKDALEKALAKCSSTKGENPCDTAYQIVNCMEKESNFHGFEKA